MVHVAKLFEKTLEVLGHMPPLELSIVEILIIQ